VNDRQVQRLVCELQKWLLELLQRNPVGDPELYAYYQRVRVKRDTNAAKVASARRLFDHCLSVLASGKVLRDENYYGKEGPGGRGLHHTFVRDNMVTAYCFKWWRIV